MDNWTSANLWRTGLAGSIGVNLLPQNKNWGAEREVKCHKVRVGHSNMHSFWESS